MHIFHTAGGRTRVNSAALVTTLMNLDPARRPIFLGRLKYWMSVTGTQY